MSSDLADDLARLAHVNHHGFAFLLAYGLRWLATAGLWNRFGPRAGGYAVLFQGLVAVPIAFGLQALTRVGARPENPLLDQLTIVLAVSQVFALPLIIYLIMARSYRMTALVFAIVTLFHFAPYSWLYQTPGTSGRRASDRPVHRETADGRARPGRCGTREGQADHD